MKLPFLTAHVFTECFVEKMIQFTLKILVSFEKTFCHAKTITFSPACFFTTLGFTQPATSTAKISITAQNQTHIPLEGATAELLRNKDSAIVKTATDRCKECSSF